MCLGHAASCPPTLELPAFPASILPACADRRYRGLQGIVVRDTAATLQLVTSDDRYVVVSKQVGAGGGLGGAGPGWAFGLGTCVHARFGRRSLSAHCIKAAQLL
jgi:hypothetical protein